MSTRSRLLFTPLPPTRRVHMDGGVRERTLKCCRQTPRTRMRARRRRRGGACRGRRRESVAVARTSRRGPTPEAASTRAPNSQPPTLYGAAAARGAQVPGVRMRIRVITSRALPDVAALPGVPTRGLTPASRAAARPNVRRRRWLVPRRLQAMRSVPTSCTPSRAHAGKADVGARRWDNSGSSKGSRPAASKDGRQPRPTLVRAGGQRGASIRGDECSCAVVGRGRVLLPNGTRGEHPSSTRKAGGPAYAVR